LLIDDQTLENFYNRGLGSITGSSLGLDAIGEFQTLTNTYGAQFGGAGAVMNAVTKSGTNSFHGSAYEYFRNSNLNAVDETWVQQGLTSNPRFDSNRFGGTFGGPIIKNKLFFFTNFERNPVGFISVGGGAGWLQPRPDSRPLVPIQV